MKALQRKQEEVTIAPQGKFLLNCAELFSEGLKGSMKLPGHTFIIIHIFNDGPVQKTVHGVLYKSRDICITF